MEGIPELGVISEQAAEEETASGDRLSTPRTPGGDVPDQGPAFPDPQQHQRQVTLSLAVLFVVHMWILTHYMYA